MNLPPRDCAAELLEVVPLMMRVIRAKVRAHSSPELSVPQFRALAFLGRNEGAMLGDVATFLVLTLSQPPNWSMGWSLPASSHGIAIPWIGGRLFLR